LKAKADAAAFVLVEPEGSPAVDEIVANFEAWNGGNCCAAAAEHHVDDVAFVRAMLDALEAEACIDPRRIFATGFSNGGIFSYRLACEASDRIAAIASVAAGSGETDLTKMPPVTTYACHPTRHVPVLQIHGTVDPCYPYGGGLEVFSGVIFEPVATTIEHWRARNGCSDAPTTLSHVHGAASCRTSACPADGTVTLCTIEGGGHHWPSGASWPGAETLCGKNGVLSHDLDANEVVWEFFQAHSLP
jgi:polyhydroxybutyrate depolymerase